MIETIVGISIFALLAVVTVVIVPALYQRRRMTKMREALGNQKNTRKVA